MSDIFKMVDIDDETSVSVESQELEKALSAGYGTDAASFEGGRALQVEDLETTLVSVLDVNQNECKLFNKVHKQPMNSTVHQILRRTSVGDDEFNFVGEGELATEDNQTLERKIFESKYLATKYQVSHQLTLTKQAESALATEKTAAVIRIARSAERGFFHGDSATNPKAFDGLLKVLKDSAANTDVPEKNRATVIDLRGKEIGEDETTGYDLFNEIAQKAMQKGGDLDEAYFPLPIAQQFYKLWNDKLRFVIGEKNALANLERLPNLPTATGSIIKIQEGNTGIDKQFRVKGVVIPAGSRELRPNSPKTVTVSAATNSSSQFTDGYEGDYVYAVHAMNAHGISAGTSPDAAVAVAKGAGVTITITPDDNGKAATGYIITRSKANGTELMEMCRIKASAEGETVYVDLNEDLPGTADIIMLSSKTQELSDNLSFAQLMPISSFELKTDSSLAHRGTVALYGTPELRAPELCALIKGVGYAGGLY